MPTLLLYPDVTRGGRVPNMCKELGFDYHNDPSLPYDLIFYWSYHGVRRPLDEFLTNVDCINKGCWDISKTKVNDVFNDISIDPETFSGVCVSKLENQGTHSGRLEQCPTKRERGRIYQKFIVDKEDDLYVKYRIYYADGIDFILKQCKPSLFGSDYQVNEAVPKERFFSSEEEVVFVDKCKAFGVDFADIEFIMDEGKPVFIDINNVAGPRYFTDEIKELMLNSFKQFIINRINQKQQKL